jgi:hypothetical protein
MNLRIYHKSKEHVEEFLKFQDSQGTRRAYMMETAQLAYRGCSEDRPWGLGLGCGPGEASREAHINAIG